MTTIQNNNLLAQRLNNEQNKKSLNPAPLQPVLEPQKKNPPIHLLLLSGGIAMANISLLHVILICIQ